MVTFIDLFCGIGGFHRAFTRAGAECVFANDYDRKSRLLLARQYSNLGKILSDQGFTVIISTISLFQEIHAWNRENLKNYLIGVSKDLLPKLNKGQYYWNELIGFEVLNLKNISFGNVDTFIETGANDVIVVRGDKERLIPYTSNTVLKVDTGGEKIIVDWDEEF